MHAPGPGAAARRAAGRAPPAARPRPGGRGAARGRHAPDRHRQQLLAGWRSARRRPVGRRGDRAAAGSTTCCHNRLFADPMLLGATRDGSRPVHRGRRRRTCWTATSTIAAPIDSFGVNYYNPTAVRRRAGPGRRAAVRRCVDRSRGYPAHRLRLAGGARRAARAADRRCATGTATPAADLHHRERLLLRRRARRRRPCTTRPRRLPGRPRPAPCAQAMRGRRRRARLLRLVAAGQLRVGGGLHASGSAWSHVDFETQSARRRPPTTGTGTSSVARDRMQDPVDAGFVASLVDTARRMTGDAAAGPVAVLSHRTGELSCAPGRSWSRRTRPTPTGPRSTRASRSRTAFPRYCSRPRQHGRRRAGGDAVAGRRRAARGGSAHRALGHVRRAGGRPAPARPTGGSARERRAAAGVAHAPAAGRESAGTGPRARAVYAALDRVPAWMRGAASLLACSAGAIPVAVGAGGRSSMGIFIWGNSSGWTAAGA